MILGELTGPAAYAFILIASAVEGEVIYIAASVLVGRGLLAPLPVIISGTLGAAAGDQFYYYAARGWLGRWFRNLKTGAARRDAILHRVGEYGAWMAFACRFLPGARIAIGLACAAANVPALRFTLANLAGSVVWACGVMAFVAWGGPQVLARLGLPSWVEWLVPAALVLAALAWVARRSHREIDVG